MSPELIFQLCSTIALIGWLLLILVNPLWFSVDKLLVGIIITLFGIVYTWLIATGFQLSDLSAFGTLDGVMQIFTDKALVTAGWVHYLAFDLMTGIWIKKNSIQHGISAWLVFPCLLLTFMFGPIGLLLYLLFRWMVTKQYFASN